jgi:hypothetical protein
MLRLLDYLAILCQLSTMLRVLDYVLANYLVLSLFPTSEKYQPISLKFFEAGLGVKIGRFTAENTTFNRNNRFNGKICDLIG